MAVLQWDHKLSMYLAYNQIQGHPCVSVHLLFIMVTPGDATMTGMRKLSYCNHLDVPATMTGMRKVRVTAIALMFLLQGLV